MGASEREPSKTLSQERARGNTNLDAHPLSGSGAGLPPPGTEGEIRLRRFLIFAVAGMGGLIAAGLLTVVGRIAYLASRASPPPTARPDAAGAALSSLVLPQAAAVKSMAVSDHRLALYYTAPEGDGITVVDLDTGRVISRIRLSSADTMPARVQAQEPAR